MLSINLLIIGFTCIVSFLCFNNRDLFLKLQHWPYQEARKGEYYRWLTSGFVHGDYMHLIFNMFTLYFFGSNVEAAFTELFPGMGELAYAIFYLVAIVAASSGTFVKNRDNPGFASIGASGAVSAILFAAILLNPLSKIYLYFIPIGIPGFLFGPIYLWYCTYAARKGGDNVDHLAHFFGAVFGFFFPLVFYPELFMRFVHMIQAYF
jgi:membrane associated rhomboid family serine protease